MGFLRRLSSLFAPPAQRGGGNMYDLAVKCARCGEVIHTQINLSNDLSVEYGESSGPTTYVCRKVLMGKARCFQGVEVTLTFDIGRRLIDRQITGGSFVEDSSASVQD